MYKSILPLPSTTCYSRCLVVELNTECGDSRNSNLRSTIPILSKICDISKSLFSYKNWNIATYKWLLQGLGIIIFTFQNIAYCMGPINGIEKVFLNENSCLRKKKICVCLLLLLKFLPGVHVSNIYPVSPSLKNKSRQSTTKIHFGNQWVYRV